MSPHPDHVTQDQLAAWLGYRPEQTARIREWLDRNGVRYRLAARGRVVTTRAAVDRAMLGQTTEVEFA